MKTAVEWLWDMLSKGEFINDPEELLNQAKAMFEEQVTLSHINGQSEFDKGAYGEHNEKLAEQYYNETFKSDNGCACYGSNSIHKCNCK